MSSICCAGGELSLPKKKNCRVEILVAIGGDWRRLVAIGGDRWRSVAHAHLVDTTAFVDEVTGRGRLASIDVADNDEVHWGGAR